MVRSKTDINYVAVNQAEAFRVDDLETMQKFYEEVIGLKLMKRFPQSAFFEVAQGYGGHTQVLALFDRSTAPDYSGLSSEK